MRDTYHNIGLKPVIAPVVVSDNTAQVGAIVDSAGYNSVTYAILTGTLADADATFTVLLEEGNAANLSDGGAVADVDLLGTEALASFIFSDDGVARKLGYIGNKRYTRLTVTPAGNSGSAPIAAVALLGAPLSRPTA